jgi:hypothetical protein
MHQRRVSSKNENQYSSNEKVKQNNDNKNIEKKSTLPMKIYTETKQCKQKKKGS